jgi:hypothetical protein
MYLVTCTRPDLAYPVSYLSQFFAAPSKSHLTAAPFLLQYIKGTNDLKLSFPCSDIYPKLLWKDIPTLTMEIVRILSQVFPVTFFSSII